MRRDDQRQAVKNIPLEQLKSFKNHPFQVRDDEEFRRLVESIEIHGVIHPAVARQIGEDCYELISGHRRKAACEVLGYSEMPVLVRSMTDDEAVVNMVDAKAAQGVADKAKEAGIPTIFFNREPDTEVIKSYDKSIFIGTNAADAGKMQGDIIKDLFDAHPEYDLNGDGAIQYVMFQGEPDNPEAIARTQYSVEQAEANGCTMERIGEIQVCNWDTEQAQRAMEALLAANEGKIELVIANNDGMAIGCIAALSNIGYNVEGGDKFIPVIGVDATDAAKDAIAKGTMSATVLQDGEAMGNAIASVALNAAAGADFLEGTEYALDDTGVAVRIPYAPYTA